MSQQTNFRLRPYASFETNHLTYANTWTSDTVRVRLLFDTYIPSLSTHDFLDDVTSFAVPGVQSLSNKTAIERGAEVAWSDSFDYTAGSLLSKAPAIWQASVWGDPSPYANGDGTVRTNLADGSWVGATTVAGYGDGDVTAEVLVTPVTNGGLEIYALQSLSDQAMVALEINAATSEMNLYQVSAGGGYTLLDTTAYTGVDGEEITLRVRGTTVYGLYDGEVVVSGTHSVGRSTGLVGFETNDSGIRLGSFTVHSAPRYTTYSADATFMSGEGLSIRYLVIYKLGASDATSPLYFLGQLDSPIDLFGGSGGFVVFNWNLTNGIWRVAS